MPRLGTFNLHASLLPQYRGAAPINWAVINGDTETGITTFFLKHEIDTYEIIQQVRVPIADTDNVEIVHDKLMYLGEIWFGNRGCYFGWKCETCSSGKFDPAGNGIAPGAENI